MPRLLIRYPDGNTVEQELERELSIGRSQENDLVFTEGGVSRRHARLFVENDEVWVEDAGSSNGTLIDGQRISGATQLGAGAELVIGSYAMSLVERAARPRTSAGGGERARRSENSLSGVAGRRSGERSLSSGPSGGRTATGALLAPPRRATSVLPAIKGAAGTRSAQATRSPSAAPQLGPQLRGLTGPWANQVFAVDRQLLIGRSSNSDVVLDDPSVSRRHAEVLLTRDGVVVRDVGSANGTLVNEEPVEKDEVILKSGDVIQVGVVELVFEEPEPVALAEVPVRRHARPRRKSSSGKFYFVVALVAVAVIAVVATAKVLAPQRAPMAVPAVPADPRQALKTEVESLLAACRTHATADLLNPAWDKAEEACRKAVEKNPIDTDAVKLLARVRRDKEAYASYAAAEKALARDANDEALERLREIPTESPYYLRAKPKALEAAAGVKRRAGEDCRRYSSREHWKQAEQACEAYMRIACQDMPSEELRPAPGERLKLTGRAGRNEWKPKDPYLRNLLEARLERDPEAGLWACPEIDILRRGRERSESRMEIERFFRERFTDRTLVSAAMDFWRGKGNEAMTRLLRLRDDPDKASVHAEAERALKLISQVHQLFNLGQGYLKADNPEKAVQPFKEALAAEREMLQGQADENPSWYARGIRTDMASAAYRRGKLLADERQNFRDACRIWKSGFEFSTGNIDLLRAMNFCSGEARKAFSAAESCEQLQQVLDFAVPRLSEAVPGDGFTEAVAEKKAQLNCP